MTMDLTIKQETSLGDTLMSRCRLLFIAHPIISWSRVASIHLPPTWPGFLLPLNNVLSKHWKFGVLKQ